MGSGAGAAEVTDRPPPVEDPPAQDHPAADHLASDQELPHVELAAEELEDDHDPFGWIGETIADKYIVESVVGEGGFGVVYRAHHRGLAEKRSEEHTSELQS